MTPEHAKTQNSNTHLHSQILWYDLQKLQKHRPKLFGLLSSCINPHINRKRAPPLRSASGYSLPHGQVLNYHSTDVLYFRVKKKYRCGILTHVTTNIHAFTCRRVEIRWRFRGTWCLRLPYDRFLRNFSKFLPAVGKLLTIYTISTSS